MSDIVQATQLNLSSGSFSLCVDACIDTHPLAALNYPTYLFRVDIFIVWQLSVCYFVLILFCSGFPSWCFVTCSFRLSLVRSFSMACFSYSGRSLFASNFGIHFSKFQRMCTFWHVAVPLLIMWAMFSTVFLCFYCDS